MYTSRYSFPDFCSSADVRKSALAAVQLASAQDDDWEVQLLVTTADAIIETLHSNIHTPCTAATEFVLDWLDFLGVPFDPDL